MEALRKIPLFRHLTYKEQTAVLSIASTRTFPAGDCGFELERGIGGFSGAGELQAVGGRELGRPVRQQQPLRPLEELERSTEDVRSSYHDRCRASRVPNVRLRRRSCPRVCDRVTWLNAP